MKVIMLLGRSAGGIGTHVAELSANLRDRGEDVIVVTHPLTAARFDFGTVRLWWPGSAGWFRALGDFRLLRRLASTSDIVHAHGHQAALLATLATLANHSTRGRRTLPKLPTPRVIVTQHNAVLAGSGRLGLKRLVQRWVARRADLVTGVSRDLVEESLRFGARHAELSDVPSPRVPALLAQPPADGLTRAMIRSTLLSSLALDQQDLGLEQESPALEHLVLPLVVTISRIAPQKNLPVLVEAASRIRSSCTWVVLGDGDPELLARLQLQVRALGAPVHFIGARSDAARWLRAAEVFVLPSQWEGQPLVVQEAMAAGTPVVATDVGGLHDMVYGTGLLVIPGDPEAIAMAIYRVLADPGLRADLAARGRKAARALPDGRDTASKWLALYAETLAMT
ncbi:MAG: glycosyltransferase family 4 protein [Actinobacteria bacterium]|nr:glycosyltransferase family 4 protein [Actinomycetota bacterium]